MDIQFPQILFQIINFGVVLGALTYLLFKPISKIFEERAKRITEGQKAAKKSIEEQEKIDELKKKTKRVAQKEAATIIEESKVQAKAQEDEIAKTAKSRSAAEFKKQQDDWQSEKQQLKKQLKNQMAEAVIQTSAKVINEKMSSKSDSALIDKELSSILSEI